MTEERITFNAHIKPANYRQLQTHPLYINLVPIMQSWQKSDPALGAENLRDWQWHQQGRKGFDDALRKVSGKDLIGEVYIEEYLRDQYRRHCRPSTLSQTLTAVDSFLGFIKVSGKDDLQQITREDLGAFIEHEQDRGLKASTVQTRLRTLKAFLRYLVDQGVIGPEVISKRMIIKVPDALPRAMEPDDVSRLLLELDHVRDRAMILVLLRTGMRVGELLNTLVEDVHLKERKIEIYEAQKNRVGRVVYLSDDALDALKAWFKKRDSYKDFVFYSQGRHRISYPAVRMRFVKYLDKAGLSHKGYTLHCLRHTCASELLNAGMRLDCVQQLLGHSSIEMTRRYARLTDKTREEEYFKAMKIIERGEIDGHYQLDPELQEIFKKEELLGSHGEELHE